MFPEFVDKRKSKYKMIVVIESTLKICMYSAMVFFFPV